MLRRPLHMTISCSRFGRALDTGRSLLNHHPRTRNLSASPPPPPSRSCLSFFLSFFLRPEDTVPRSPSPSTIFRRGVPRGIEMHAVRVLSGKIQMSPHADESPRRRRDLGIRSPRSALDRDDESSEASARWLNTCSLSFHPASIRHEMGEFSRVSFPRGAARAGNRKNV